MAMPKAHLCLGIRLNRIVHEAQLRCCWGAGGALKVIFASVRTKLPGHCIHLQARP